MKLIKQRRRRIKGIDRAIEQLDEVEEVLKKALSVLETDPKWVTSDLVDGKLALRALKEAKDELWHVNFNF